MNIESPASIECHNYNGVQKFKSWPLRYFNDEISKKLEDESWDKWFSYFDVYELVPQTDFIKRYIEHCRIMNVKTEIMKIETPRNNQVALNELSVVETLGYDCIAGTDLSYLCLPLTDLENLFPSLCSKLNSNGLFDSLKDACEFLSIYNKLLNKGVSLEDWGTPLPAKISIVKV